VPKVTVLTAGVTCLVVVGAVACGSRATAPSSPQATSAGRVSSGTRSVGAGEVSPGPTPPAPADVAGVLLVGADGAAAWQLTSTGLSITRDAGAHWSRAPLPPGVVAASVGAIAAEARRGVWLAVSTSSRIDVYHSSTFGGSWTDSRLVPSNPPGLSVGGQSPAGSITVGPGRMVIVVAAWGFTTFSAYSRIFVSADDGASFAQHPSGTSSHIFSVGFVDPLRGISVAGPTGLQNQVARTADGGASWTPVAIPIHAEPTQQAEVGIPHVDGTILQLPVTVTDRSGDQRVAILRSTDGGATFTRPIGAPLTIAADTGSGDVSAALLGNLAWMPARGKIYQSADAGRSWTPITTSTFAWPLTLISASSAIGIATDSGCAGFKSDCHDYNYLVATNDGGRSWRTLSPH
jgi:hypothetical protein